ncbi:MAG: PEP-CTERM sorting domain-containing protein [Myxococcota bacterium]|nr:PEP-CTERM sorting domain-containing protein [Myxococcota bacterium]
MLALGAAPVSASTIYRYEGADYATASSPYTTSMSMVIKFEVASPLAPNLSEEYISVSGSFLDWTIDDGVTTYTAATPGIRSNFVVSTDAGGDITGWAIGAVVSDPPPNTFVESCSGDYRVLIPGNVGLCTAPAPLDSVSSTVPFVGLTVLAEIPGAPGSWTVVPEPSSAGLAALGLAGVGWRARRKRRGLWWT